MKQTRWKDDRGALLRPHERELIYGRWLEAADVLLRLPPVRYPKQFGNSMPEVQREWTRAELNEYEQWRNKSDWSWGPMRKPPPSAAAITRMEEITEISLKYLMGWPFYRPCAPRDCLWASAICAVSGRSFAGVCRKRGWAKTTAFRRIDQAIIIVRDGLKSDNRELQASPVDYVERSEPLSPL